MDRINKINIFKKFDIWLILFYLVLNVIGFFSIYAASHTFESSNMFDFSVRSGKQMIWFLMALVIAFFILFQERNFFYNVSYPLYFSICLLLIVTIFIAPDVKGSHSWLVFGPFRIQPAEFSKFITSLALARFMSSYVYDSSKIKSYLIAFLILIVPAFLILLSSETGSALVFVSFMMMFYRKGMPGVIIILGLFAIYVFVFSLKFSEYLILTKTSLGSFIVFITVFVLFISFIVRYTRDIKTAKFLSIFNVLVLLLAILINYFKLFLFDVVYLQLILLGIDFVYITALSFLRMNFKYLIIGSFVIISVCYLFSVNYTFKKILQPHQQVRIEVLLGMKEDANGAGYNVNQSKIAIGSGGFFGKGFLNGTQTNLSYVPEQDTDFIFCTVGEELGFIGSSIIVIIYFLFLYRIIKVAERQKSEFSQIYGYCVASIFFFHVLINIGMVLGILPVIGIPLPFLSYGGSSLWSFTILLFIFIRIDSQRGI